MKAPYSYGLYRGLIRASEVGSVLCSFLGGTAGPEGRLTPVQGANQECKREENVSLNTIEDVGAGRQGSDQGLWQRHEVLF